jgi:two-component system, OmpR family, sensor kinase
LPALKRLPIKARVTLAFAGATALLLVALGLFIYLRFESRLDQEINQNLRTRASEVAHGVRRAQLAGSPAGAALVEGEESFAQVLGLRGTPLAPRTGPAASTPLLRPDEVALARRHPIFVGTTTVALSQDPVRLFAEPAKLPNGPVLVVTGVPLDDRRDTLANLRDLLIVGGAAALVVASMVGYIAVAAALRPVEAMRRRAAEISAAEPQERLPVGDARDELSRLGETLNAMLGRIHDALERERRFLDDASHELRTPLALHKTELEIALRYGREPSELRTSIASAIEEADRLAELAEDLLVVARSEDGALDLRLEAVQLPPLLEELRERFRRRAGADRRAVAVDTDGAYEVEADRQRLERALINMVDNAFRHGGGEITLRAARGDGRIELHVADRGPGFPPEFLDRAFERFSRADPARRRGGTGLGLAIVDRIARAHGGRAHAANRAGGGADVWIELPSRPA